MEERTKLKKDETRKRGVRAAGRVEGRGVENNEEGHAVSTARLVEMQKFRAYNGVLRCKSISIKFPNVISGRRPNIVCNFFNCCDSHTVSCNYSATHVANLSGLLPYDYFNRHAEKVARRKVIIQIN